MIQFQHTACSLDIPNSVLTLYGRTKDGSAAIHTKIEPHLLCGKDPRYITGTIKSRPDQYGISHEEKVVPAIPSSATVRIVKGNDITAWVSRVFYKVYFKSVVEFFKGSKDVEETSSSHVQRSSWIRLSVVHSQRHTPMQSVRNKGEHLQQEIHIL